MKRQYLANFYSLRLFTNLILDTVATHVILKTTSKKLLNHSIYLGNLTFLMSSKALVLMDVYFFFVFYLNHSLNAIYQDILMHMISIGIWIILAVRLNFATVIIVMFVYKTITVFVLLISLYYMEDLVYIRFNKKIGTDSLKIKNYLLYELIVTLKYVDVIFELIALFVALALEHGIGRKPYSFVKIMIFFTDIYIRRQQFSFKKYLHYTTPIYAFGFVYGIFVLIIFFVKNVIQYNMVFLFFRIMNFLILCFSLIAIYKFSDFTIF